MRIGVVSQFYAPEPGPAQLPTALAEGLAARGHDVRVVTGFPNYPSGRLDGGYQLRRATTERLNGVDVRRVYLHPAHRSAFGRAANYASFGASSVINGLPCLLGVDALWVNASPITLAWPIWAARALGIPAVSHVLDLWPESLHATGFGTAAEGFLADRALHAWANSMYRGSHHVAYISPSVGEILRGRGVPRSKLNYVPMWADEDTFHPGGRSLRKDLGIAEDAVVITYAGTLGKAQGVLPLLEAAELVGDLQIVVLIAGSGLEESAIRHAAEGSTTVHFLGRLPKEQMTDLMATSDACYVSLRDTSLGRVSLPSKTQAALASGVPVLVAAEGDVRRLVTERGVGLGTAPEHVEGIARMLSHFCALPLEQRAAMGRSARALYDAEFSLERALGQVECLLSSAAHNRKWKKIDG